VTRDLSCPLSLILTGFAILATHREDPPPDPDPGPPAVRLHVVSVDARVLRADDGTPPRLEIAVTGLAPTTGYDVGLVPLPGRPLEFELVGRPPPPGTPIAPVEQIFTVIRTVALPEELPVTVRVVQPERYVSRRVD
jgi:hypothetical protein